MVPLLIGGLVVSGFFSVTWNVGVTTFRQHQIAPEMMGRVSAAARTIGFGVLPIGSALGGLLGQALTAQLGDRLGLAATLAAGSLVAASSAVALIGARGFERDS